MRNFQFFFRAVCVLMLFAISGCRLTEKVQINHFATEIVVSKGFHVMYYEQEGIIAIYPRENTTEAKFYTALDEDKKEFERLANEMGDTCHSETITLFRYSGWGLGDEIRTFRYHPVNKLTVKSSIDWGSELPAGSDLSAQFLFLSANYDKFVRTCSTSEPKDPYRNGITLSGYIKSKADIAYNEAKDTGRCQIVLDYLNKVRFEEMTFVGINGRENSNSIATWGFLYSVNANMKKPQTLTLEFTSRDGTVTTETVDITEPADIKG